MARKGRVKLCGLIHRLPVIIPTKQVHDSTSTLKSTTNRVIEMIRKDLQKANIKLEELLDKDTLRNKIHKWKMVV